MLEECFGVGEGFGVFWESDVVYVFVFDDGCFDWGELNVKSFGGVYG